MDVLMEILLEHLESLVKSLAAKTPVSGESGIATDLTQCAQNVAGSVVIHHHHANRIVDCGKGSERRGPVLGLCTFELQNIRKQNLFRSEEHKSELQSL